MTPPLRIYLDNAATTALDPAVLEAMMPFLTKAFGNPSSLYSYGREAKMAIETARKTIAKILNAHPAELFFTSGGTESSNAAIRGAVYSLGCTHIITSPLEHHATLHCVEQLANKGLVKITWLKVLPDGHVDLKNLEQILSSSTQKTLVTLMHANNEIGNLTDIHLVGNLCKQYQAIFHSDTVQTVGHFPMDLRNTPVHFINAAAHKFHGPKGVGLLYVNENIKIDPLLLGGSQERNMRAGTENVSGIVGLAKALEIATAQYTADRKYIQSLKQCMITTLQQTIQDIEFNGDIGSNSLYTVLNVSFPKTEKSEMILFNLDINHICASGGSACTSGANTGSHVIRSLHSNPNRLPVRFSFSKHNTQEEITYVVEQLKTFL